MATRGQRTRLALFFLIVVGAFTAFALVVAGDTLWQQYDQYYIRYTDASVAGLQSGGTVIYQGIAIGRIERIEIDPQDIQSIIVTIRVERGTPIKEDVRAQIVPVGITGISQIELSGGTRAAGTVPPGSFIDPSPSTFAQVTETIQSVLVGLEQVLLDVSGVLAQVDQDSVGNILSRIDSILATNEERVASVLIELDAAAGGLSRFMSEAEGLMATTREGSEEVFATLDRFTAEAEELFTATRDGTRRVLEGLEAEIGAAELARVGEQIRQMVSRGERIVSEVELTVRRNRSSVDRSIDLLQDTLRLLNNAAFQIDTDPSILVIPVERR